LLLALQALNATNALLVAELENMKAEKSAIETRNNEQIENVGISLQINIIVESIYGYLFSLFKFQFELLA